jgi:hypothetical protein
MEKGSEGERLQTRNFPCPALLVLHASSPPREYQQKLLVMGSVTTTVACSSRRSTVISVIELVGK